MLYGSAEGLAKPVPLHDREGWPEQHLVATLHEFMADRRNAVRLAASGQTERENILGTLDEITFAQRRQLTAHFARQPFLIAERSPTMG